MLDVVTVEYETVESAKDIALKSWNIKREVEKRNGYFNVEFIEDTKLVKVKYLDNGRGNFKEVIGSWGTVLDNGKEIFLSAGLGDLKSDVVNQVDKAYEEDNSGEITFSLKD